ncbi:hypothetical protein [Mangrovibacterium lignilyticum]|uniref:hypothetical protein n=1 Tax=Mangrovibacterium lignilyticum TaxID=2668052 RepID=UPI0013D8B8E3|nr:hypothetical protein [Mangrovibacterium lignilyticum]
MRNANLKGKSVGFKINLEEFRKLYRSVHQLAAMKVRTDKENELFYAGLKRSTELLHYIHPYKDQHIDEMLNFSFRYYMTKKEEALDGNEQSQKIVNELKPLYQKELMSLIHLN